MRYHGFQKAIIRSSAAVSFRDFTGSIFLNHSQTLTHRLFQREGRGSWGEGRERGGSVGGGAKRGQDVGLVRAVSAQAVQPKLYWCEDTIPARLQRKLRGPAHKFRMTRS